MGLMVRLVDDPHKGAQTLTFPIDGNSRYNSDQKVFRKTDAHLRSEYGGQLAVLDFLIDFYTGKVSGS